MFRDKAPHEVKLSPVKHIVNDGLLNIHASSIGHTKNTDTSHSSYGNSCPTYEEKEHD